MTANSLAQQPAPAQVLCQHCGKIMFDGEIIRARVVDPFKGTAKCTWCKNWTPVPVVFAPIPST